MRWTIIVSDNVVIVEGKAHRVDCSALAGVHAVQWRDLGGEIEYAETTDGQPPNEFFLDPAPYQSLLDAWQVIEDAPPPPPPELPPEVIAFRERVALFAADTDREDLVSKLRDATPEQIKTYITNNVTNLAEARVLLTKMALVLATLVR